MKTKRGNPILGASDPRVTKYLGIKFGHLTAIRFVKSDGGQYWEWLCDCGNHTIRRLPNVKLGHPISCGCMERLGPMKHGCTAYRRKDPFYQLWQNMISRCITKSNPRYRDYGARGITVCERWRDFRNFRDDMMMKPKGMTLERRDNNGPYSPENCVWASRKTQARNRKSNHQITFGNKTMCLVEWSEESGIPYSCLVSRLNNLHWSVQRALTVPVRQSRRCLLQ